MKTIKYIAIATAVLALASCSSVELDSAKQAAGGRKPLEFSLVVKNQTRADQIVSTNLSKLYMTTVGTFYSAAGAEVVNPTLELTKGEQGWSYIYNGLEGNNVLYWPMEGLQNAQFRAWYYDGTTAAAKGALDNKAADLDAVGAYTTINYVSGAQNVPLNMYHAVSKAEFKAKVLTKSADGPYKIKVDIKNVSLHNMAYKASAYTAPESTSPMGAFTVVSDDTRDLLAAPASHDFIGQSSAATTIGTMFVMPQAIEAQDFSATTWDKPYISILAQICTDETGNVVPIFPKNATANDYAWIALPLPSDFTAFQAHHKYIFTINLRDDAMGVADKDQYPNKEEMDNPDNPTEDDEPYGEDTEDLVPEGDRGKEITIEGRSAFSFAVTVEDVYDFDEYPEGQEPNTEISVNDPENVVDLSTLTADYEAQNGDILANTLAGNYRITIADGATVTLRNVTINIGSEDYSALSCDGSATIILDAGTTNTLCSPLGSDYPALRSAHNTGSGDEYTLTITGTGSLTATSYGKGAGIGGGYGIKCGNIRILNGDITASGGSYAAGIGGGGGENGTCGNILIEGGSITANAGSYASGIGGGRFGSCGTVTITDGVTSVSAKRSILESRCIGKGADGSCGTVTIGDTAYSDGATPNQTDNKTFVYPIPGWDGNLATLTGEEPEGFATATNGMTITGTLGVNVKVSIADGASVTLSDVSINASDSYDEDEWAGITCLGDATITLMGNNIVRGFEKKYPGIFVPAAKTLIIDGDGSLTASSSLNPEDGWAAGIGACWTENCGNIVINGGTIIAQGSDEGAGIGGTTDATCGNITINGGNVTATAIDGNAGIGSGEGETCGTITISGGTVNATGGEYAAGIGSGNSSADCGIITISGGTVEATGGEMAAGIGSGQLSSCGNISISGGTITATGGEYGAGIGSGAESASCGTVTITSGVTLVTATKGSNSPNSIGAGHGSTCGTVTIGGNTGAISTSPYTYPIPVLTVSISSVEDENYWGQDLEYQLGETWGEAISHDDYASEYLRVEDGKVKCGDHVLWYWYDDGEQMQEGEVPGNEAINPNWYYIWDHDEG